MNFFQFLLFQVVFIFSPIFTESLEAQGNPFLRPGSKPPLQPVVRKPAPPPPAPIPHNPNLEFRGYFQLKGELHFALFDKSKKYIWTFASYEKDDELFSDRNVFPKGCIIKMEKVNEK